MTPYLREYTQSDGSTMICEARRINGVVVRLPTRYVRPGGTEAKPEPKQARGVFRKAANFAKATAKHVAAGRPMATDEQVGERFTVCQACPHFTATGEGQGECAKCGCGLKAVGVAGLSKLRWATEACPIGKWKALPAK